MSKEIDDRMAALDYHDKNCDDADWMFVPDWEGDPSLPNGTRDTSYWLCSNCELEQDERPAGIESSYPGPDFEPEPDMVPDERAADFVFSPRLG
jgi:hypothetical protein